MQIRWKYLLAFLTLVASLVWIAIVTFPDKNLHFIACDVGQGDAILAIYGKTQILVDGGPDSSVIGCLSRYMPFWDREVEMIVNTHPQKDHYMGLIEVFKTYKVDNFVATSLDSSSQDWQVLKELVGSKGTRVINPVSGQKLRIGLIYLDIVWPTNNFISVNLGKNDDISTKSSAAVLGAYTTKKDPNEFSVVTILSFREFNALLTGDVGPDVTDDILKTGLIRDVDYIKIPHHGSKNGLTRDFLVAADPEVAVISVGKNNSYGHPHQEVIKLLSDKEIKILRTDEIGDVVVESDGEKVWIEN